MVKRASILSLKVFLLVSSCCTFASGQEFWSTKPFVEWSKAEAEQVLKDNMKLRGSENGEGWVSGKFLHPHDACFDPAGNIFVAEVGVGNEAGHRVQKFRIVASR